MKKGFTLTELIAVISLLSLLVLVAGISYKNYNDIHKEKACEVLKKQLETSAIEYAKDTNLLHTKDSDSSITYNTLVSEEYIEDELVNPINDMSLYDSSIEITVKKIDGNYSATSTINCGE